MNYDLSKQRESTLLIISKSDLDHYSEILLVSRAETSDNFSEILSATEAANFLKISKSALYQLTSKNQLIFYKKNKLLYFKKSDLLSWIDEGRQPVVIKKEKEGNDV